LIWHFCCCAGQPIAAVALGGSITGGGDIYYPRLKTDSFVGQAFTWLNTTFPHAEHRFHNGALSATGSTLFAICLKGHIRYEDVDLVILEFDINDSAPGNESTRLFTEQFSSI
jgi:hypothetical protein